ncbi:MAG: pyridoxamine 5'-phosphate oxidase family protein [Myxococcota bacterium]
MEAELHPDEAAAAAAAERDDPATVARGWLLAVSDATLSTTAVQRGLEGFPYGSVVPYALDGAGRPLVLLSDIAAHTQNLRKDPRASLFVRQPDTRGDPQAGWRLTVMGELERLSDGDETDALWARYLERVPDAVGYRQMHDFAFWRMSSPVKARYIGGFGKICWVAGEALLRDPQGEGLREAGPGACAHLDEDHADALLDLCEGLHGFRPAAAHAEAVDRTGLFVRTTGPERLVHCSFGREIDADGLRVAVIETLRRARARRASP